MLPSRAPFVALLVSVVASSVGHWVSVEVFVEGIGNFGVVGLSLNSGRHSSVVC